MNSYVYTKNGKSVREKRLGGSSDFDEWANQVVAALKTHRLQFGESAGQASPSQNPTGLSRWASRVLGS